MAFLDPNDPTVDNDSSEGFKAFDEWINTTSNTTFRLLDASVGAADWQPVVVPSLSILSWRFSTSTTAADPGKGRFRMNNATPASVTALYFDAEAEGGLNVKNLFDNLGAGGRLAVQQADDPDKVLVFEIASSLTDNTGWWTIPVTVLDSTGALFGNNKTCAWFFRFSGVDVGGLNLADDHIHQLGSLTHSADTLANLNSKVSDATLDDAGDARPPLAHTVASHSDTSATGAELETLTDGSNADSLHVHAGVAIAHSATTGRTADDHHAQAHTVASHSDTAATGAQLDTLTDGSNADFLHSHAGATPHSATTGQTTDDHHPQAHTVASHSDTSATGAQLDALTDGSSATFLHTHSHATTTGQTADDHHAEAHTVASHSDTTATGAELETLTDGSNADSLHAHAAPAVAHSATTGQTADDHHSQAHTVASHSDTTATGAELDTLTDGSNADSLHVHAGASAFPDRGCVQSKNAARLIGVSVGSVLSVDGTKVLTLASAGEIDLDTNGADGLDTGTVATDTHYSVWVIGDSTDTNPTATLASLSTTSPTMPSGYDRKRRRGWVLTDGSSNIHPFVAQGGTGQRAVAYTYERADAVVFVAQDTQVWLAQDLTAQLPPTARLADVTLLVEAGNADFVETRITGSTAADGEGRQVMARNNASPTVQWTQTLDSSQSLDWRKNDTTGDASMYVWGYQEDI